MEPALEGCAGTWEEGLAAGQSPPDLTATLEAGDLGAVDHDVDHLAAMGLLERDGDEVHLTREGEVAASRLP